MPEIYAIGDIHGCYNTFKNLLLEKIRIQKQDKIYCVGDFIDRGNNSKGVIDLIIGLRSEGYQIYTIRGNHEQMLLDSTIDEERLHQWIENGGAATLKSFGISSVKELSSEYVTFFKETKFFIEADSYIFVHAGLNFRIQDPFTDREAMLWIRDEYFDNAKINNKLLVHGHTPISFENLFKQLNLNKINIDGGCVYKNKKGFGNLVALALPGKKLISARNID